MEKRKTKRVCGAKMIKRYDLNVIKAIPILDYLKKRCIEVKNNRCAAVWRGGDNKQSVRIDLDRNDYTDFVFNKRGSVIDICMAIEGLDFNAAVNSLAQQFNIQKTECCEYTPPPAPLPKPDFINVGWAIQNKDTSKLNEIDMRATKRVLELANGAQDEAAIDKAITQVCDEWRNNGPKEVLATAGIVFTDACDFVKAELPPPVWIVQDFIAVGMKGDLCGGSKTNKTFLARQLAACIASGQKFLDTYEIIKPHKVACIDLELFPWNSKERMVAQAMGLGIDWEQYKGNLLITHLRGCAQRLRENVDPLVDYLTSEQVEVVVIDPRYKLLQSGEDENTSEGLRGILEFRDTLSKHFATMLVTHDAKGDTSQRKTTDRGAGSYTAGADFDFRLTIDNAEGWTSENRIYVIEAEGRARKTPPPMGVRFRDDVLVFSRDNTVAPVKQDRRKNSQYNAESRAVKEVATQNAYKDAAISVAVKAGDRLLSVGQFDSEVAKCPGASLGVNRRAQSRGVLVKDGTLATCSELERKQDGSVVRRKHGATLISTPDRIKSYQREFGIDV